MANNGLFALLGGMPGNSAPGGGATGRDNASRRNVEGFVKSLVQAAGGAERRGSLHGRNTSAPGAGPERVHRPGQKDMPGAREQTALERIGDMARRGTLDHRQLDDMSEEDWAELEAWALAGAGGLFEPVADTLPTGVGLGEDDAGLLLQVNDALGRAALADLLRLLAHAGSEMQNAMGEGMAAPLEQLLNDALAEAGSVATLNPEDVATLLGTEALDDSAMRLLAGQLREAIAAVAGEGGAAVEAARELPGPALGAVLAEALQGAGVASRDGSTPGETPDLPEAVLRSLAVKLIDADSGNAEIGLLDRLAWDAALRERLAALAGSPAAESVAEANVSAAASADALDLAEGAVHIPNSQEGGEVLSGTQGDADAGSTVDIGLPTEGAAASDAAREARAERRDATDMMQGTPRGEAGDPVVEVLPAGAAESDAGGEGASGHGEADAAPDPVQVSASSAAAEDSASTVPAARASANTRPVDVTPTQMTENIERVEQVMRLSVQRGIQRVAIRLDPPELGQVTLRLEMRHGVVNATLRTETVEARQVLLTGLDQLRQNLEVRGIHLEQFDVDLSGGGLAEGQEQAWQEPGRSRQNARSQRAESVEETASEAPGGPPSLQPWMGDGLNIVA